MGCFSRKTSLERYFCRSRRRAPSLKRAFCRSRVPEPEKALSLLLRAQEFNTTPSRTRVCRGSISTQGSRRGPSKNATTSAARRRSAVFSRITSRSAPRVVPDGISEPELARSDASAHAHDFSFASVSQCAGPRYRAARYSGSHYGTAVQ